MAHHWDPEPLRIPDLAVDSIWFEPTAMTGVINFEQDWDSVKEKTFLHRFKAREIYRLLSTVLTSNLSGDIAECGVYEGGISALLAKIIQNQSPEKRIHLFDSFEGLPKLDHNKDLKFYGEGMMSFPENSVCQFFEEQQLTEFSVFHPGWFDQTLPKLEQEQSFCFIHIDCDIYPSTVTCLEYLYDRMEPGGIFVFDDYFDFGGGEKKALDEFLEDTGELLFAGPIEQVHFVKGRKLGPEDEPFLCQSYHKDDTPVSLCHLFEDIEYLQALQGDPFMETVPGGGVRGAASLAEETLRSSASHPDELELAKQAIRVRDYYDLVLDRAAQFHGNSSLFSKKAERSPRIFERVLSFLRQVRR